MLFQTANGLVGVPTAAHIRAASVCNSVRTALSDFPMTLTSSNSVAYCSLVNDGGGVGRYCVEVNSAIGAAFWRCVNVGRGIGRRGRLPETGDRRIDVRGERGRNCPPIVLAPGKNLRRDARADRRAAPHELRRVLADLFTRAAS